MQALFARQPEMVLDTGAANAVEPPPVAIEPGHASAKRPRRECSSPVLYGTDAAAGIFPAAAAATDAAAVPMTPQLQRRTSAPY